MSTLAELIEQIYKWEDERAKLQARLGELEVSIAEGRKSVLGVASKISLDGDLAEEEEEEEEEVVEQKIAPKIDETRISIEDISHDSLGYKIYHYLLKENGQGNYPTSSQLTEHFCNVGGIPESSVSSTCSDLVNRQFAKRVQGGGLKVISDVGLKNWYNPLPHNVESVLAVMRLKKWPGGLVRRTDIQPLVDCSKSTIVFCLKKLEQDGIVERVNKTTWRLVSRKQD